MVALCECGHERDDHIPEGSGADVIPCQHPDCSCPTYTACHDEPGWVDARR